MVCKLIEGKTEEEERRICLNCPFPQCVYDLDRPKEETMNVHIAAKNKYYEDNKQAIVADLLSKGKAYTRRRWKIPKGSLGRLITRWLTEEQSHSIPISEPEAPFTTPESPHPSTNSTPSNGRLPPFPQFSNAWEPEVQLQWFEVYETLATRQHSR